MITEKAQGGPRTRNHILCIFRLCKAEISFFSALSAAAGLLLAKAPSAGLFVLVASGVWLMASGAGTLNHYQERTSDTLMPRTAGRPLPSGQMKPAFAVWMSVVLIGSGSAVLCFTGSPLPSLLGLAAVLWYNGFYTWFKTRSPFAAVPGALVGIIPPAIGWAAGGGHLLDFKLAQLCFFFFMWQVLHFFTHILSYASEYEKAGLLSLSGIFTRKQIKRLTFQWLLAVAVSALLIGPGGLVQSPLVFMAIVAVSFRLVLEGISFIKARPGPHIGLFKETNYYMLIVMTLLILDGYFHRS